MSDERKVNKVDVSKVSKGDLMAFTYYVKVNSVNGDKLMVDDLLHGVKGIQVTGKDLITNSMSADQFAEEEKVSMTKAAELLITSHNRPLTVCFEKKDGSERVLRGRFIRHEALLGRSMVEDLDIAKTDKEDGLRQVDHRTIRYLVVDGVKYVVNKK